MELNEYKEIRNKRYSPKDILAYLIISSNNICEKNLQSLLNSFENELLKNIDNKDILENIEKKIKDKIINSWDLSIEQAISYAYIVFDTLIFIGKGFSNEYIAEVFAYIMTVYTPDNAEDFVNQKNNNFGDDVK